MAFDNLLSLLSNLKEDTIPVWGKMTSQHMIEHLILAVQSSNGKLIIDKCINPPDKYPLMVRILLSSKPLPKNFTNPVFGEGLQPLVYPNLETSIMRLNNEINDFIIYFEEHPEAKPLNATFGPLNFEEWKTFHNKHFTHHFTQFGLLESY